MIPKTKLVTHRELLEVLNYDPQSGLMSWKCPTRRHSQDIGSIHSNGRRYISIDRKAYGAHRLAWFYVTTAWPNGNVRPINGNYLDLRFENLAIETPSDTARHSKHKSNNTSGFRGVSWDKTRGRWIATIRESGAQRTLGRFATKQEAAAAYQAAHTRITSQGAPVPEDIEIRREKARVYARYRALWKRTLRGAAGLTAWASFEEFCTDIGSEHRNHQTIVAIDGSRPVGPNNWKWTEPLYAQFDTSTREGRNAYERAVKEKSPHIWRDQRLRASFGITLVDYHRMLDAQGGVCATCGEAERRRRGGKLTRLAVDHCHSTGAIRGLLCSPCNQAIGLFRDDPDLLRKAAAYLERHAKASPSAASSSTALTEGVRST